MFLMANEFEVSILVMICSNFSGSMSVSGLMMAMVKGWLICLGSKRGYSMGFSVIKLYI